MSRIDVITFFLVNGIRKKKQIVESIQNSGMSSMTVKHFIQPEFHPAIKPSAGNHLIFGRKIFL
jgi:hypothetical protein